MTIKELQSIVDKQAEDDGLWFHARYASEAYLQQELRKLHDAIETLDGGKPSEPKEILYSGQCSHGQPLGQPCEKCRRFWDDGGKA